MKKNTKIVLALLTLGIAISCKQATDEEGDAVMDMSAVATDSTSVISSSAAVQPKNSNRKFVRTADIKFKVKNVAKSTYAIENATNKFGGFVTYTNLESHINDKSETRVSQDSILETIKYTVDNNITIRVPNTKLDTVIKTIAKEINFLDSRLIKADDVTLQMLSNKLTQKRSTSTESRIAKDIETKGKKLNQIIEAEETLESKKEGNDNKTIENLSLNDQVNFSTLTIQLYQRESIKNELFASEKSINKYRPHLGLQLLDGLKTGWFMLETIIAFIVQLWALILIGVLSWLGYKKYLKK
jgi:Domain of unknown function (DUF4349)